MAQPTWVNRRTYLLGRTVLNDGEMEIQACHFTEEETES